MTRLRRWKREGAVVQPGTFSQKVEISMSAGVRYVLSGDLEISPDVLSEILREDEVQPAIFAFNTNPSKGISLLCQAFRVSPTPKGIANILHVAPGLLSTRVGEFLAKRENQEILTAYFMQIDLHCPFVQALRIALSGSLHLPGEGEQIDRIVQTWAQCYVSCNPECGMDGDHAYILAFACVLLNSDLHNPIVKRRMTVDEFIENVRGAVPATAIPDEMLRGIYNEIKEKPFQFKSSDPDEFFALAAPRVKGELEKKSSSWASKWTSHFFVLTNSCVYYFKDSQQISADSPQGMIQLVGVRVSAVEDDRIEIEAIRGDLQYVKFKRRKPEMVKNVKSMQFRAASRRIRDKWLYRLKGSCVYSNFTGDAGTGQLSDVHASIADMATITTSDSLTSRLDVVGNPDSGSPGGRRVTIAPRSASPPSATRTTVDKPITRKRSGSTRLPKGRRPTPEAPQMALTPQRELRNSESCPDIVPLPN